MHVITKVSQVLVLVVDQVATRDLVIKTSDLAIMLIISTIGRLDPPQLRLRVVQSTRNSQQALMVRTQELMEVLVSSLQASQAVTLHRMPKATPWPLGNYQL